MPSKQEMSKTITRLHDALAFCEGARQRMKDRLDEHWEQRRIARVIRKLWWVRVGLWARRVIFRKGAF